MVSEWGKTFHHQRGRTYFLVLARSEAGTNDGRGLSMFIYDRNSNAVTVRRIENKLGIKGSPTCELVFKMLRPNW